MKFIKQALSTLKRVDIQVNFSRVIASSVMFAENFCINDNCNKNIIAI